MDSAATPTPTVLWVTAAYLVACLLVGLWPRRNTTIGATGYVAGDRSLGLVLTYFIASATILSVCAPLAELVSTSSRRAPALWILLGGILGFLPFYFLGPRAARLGKRHGFVTQAEMVAHRFQLPALAGVMAAVSVIAFVPFLALQMKGAGIMLAAATRGAVNQEAGAAIVYAAVLVYVWKNGVLGVGWTKALQVVAMLAMACAVGLYLPQDLHAAGGEMTARTGSWSRGEFASAILVSATGISCWPHLFMKAFAARDGSTLRRAVLLYPALAILLALILFTGAAQVLVRPAPPELETVMQDLVMNANSPDLLVGLICAGALAASMASGDTVVHATASILVRDGWVTALKRRLAPAAERRMMRWMVIAVVLASYAVSVFYEGSLVELFLMNAMGSVVQLAPVLAATLYSKKATGAGVLSGLLAGVTVTMWYVEHPELRPFELHPGVYGLAVNALALVVMSVLTRERFDPHATDFLIIAKDPQPATTPH